MKKILFILICWLPTINLFSQQKIISGSYFPSSGEWKKQLPGLSGFDTIKLNEAMRYAIANESKNPRDMELSQKSSFGKEPFGEGIGPFANRGDMTGIIIHHGYIIAEWGEPNRVDMTHSVTKSFLSTLVGLAVENKLIKKTSDKVSKYVNSATLYEPEKSQATKSRIYPFSGAHNKLITWETMLRQTSDWEGTLWSKPDWADRPDKDSTKWHNSIRNKPGMVFEYNDVRVNALALAATLIWKKSLPAVLKEKVMDPIGASDTWKWHGYKNSWIEIDGEPIQSVSGGGHWGGGMFINAYDMARFGLLTLHKGNWNGKQLIPEEWIESSVIPTTANPGYGYMNFYLNTEKKKTAEPYKVSLRENTFMHVGNGTNLIYVNPKNDLVMVVRWIENNAANEMIRKVISALE